MKNGALSENEIKARLAQAEVHFSHYRWEEAIAAFEVILAGHPDHPLATQGWANAVEQRTIDEELSQAVAKARGALAADHFEEALSLLNQAQARGALSHILRHHSEIDSLRSEAQEGQEWQRRVDAALREAEAAASRRRFDQALEVLDNTLRPLNGRGWERLGARLAAQREKLWAERNVSERVQFAQAAFDREDYGMAAELAAVLQEELPGREDVRRLHERARGAWSGLQERLAAVNVALAEGRTDDALALIANLRAEHPLNADWKAIALRVHMDQGRAEMSSGRAAMAEQAYAEAAEAFEASELAFEAVVEIFPEHPTARAEQSEAEALRHAALTAGQAVLDVAAWRWEAGRQGWQASSDELKRAARVRGRDFGEVAAVIDARLGEAQAALTDLEQARLSLADGRQALDAREAGRARDAFRAGLARVEGGRLGSGGDLAELREGLAAGLREAERVQRDVKKLLGQAQAAGSDERLALLTRAYERWESAPGVVAGLAEELLRAAGACAKAGDEDAALAYCGKVAELTGVGEGALSQAAGMAADIRAQRTARAAEAEAAQQKARAEAVERALAPVVKALQDVEASFLAAEGGELGEVDWDAAGQAVSRARKALTLARKLPPPLPAEWDELRGRVDALERRNRLLQRTQDQIAAGNGIEAIPALQSYLASEPDAIVYSVRDRLQHESANRMGGTAREWQAQASAALERGELATARAYVELAQSYAAVAPQETPQIRRIERQIAMLTEVRDRTREARALAATGDLAGALAAYRSALELATDGESGLPQAARRALNRVLDQDAEGDEPPLPEALGETAHPLVIEFIGPALGHWLRLTRQAMALAKVEVQVALGQEALAAEAAAGLAAAYPRDGLILEAHRAASTAARERLAAQWRRRLARAQWLAERGAYGDALAEIEVAGVGEGGERAGQDAETLSDEAADLRLSLPKLQALGEKLGPLVDQMRELALEGSFDEALSVRKQAEFLDPNRQANALWADLDRLAKLIEERRMAAATPATVAQPPVKPIEPTAPAKENGLGSGDSSTERGYPAQRFSYEPPPEARGFEDAAGVRPEEIGGGGRAVAAAPHAPDGGAQVDNGRPHEEPRREMDAPALAAPSGAAPAAEERANPPIPFDVDDWLSNVTELSPEDEGLGNGS